MSIAIVIPTHDRYEKLRNLLSSMREWWSDEIDSVIVVDDSDSKQDLKGFADLRLRHIRLGSRIFISKAKNIGWRSSTSEFVYFIDDDNMIGNSTIGPVFEKIAGSGLFGAIMPAVLYKSHPNLVWVYATPFLNNRMDLNLIGRNQPRNPSLENRLLNTDALPNASIVRRRALETVGGFDERLVVNSSLDFSQRLKRSGWNVIGYTGAFIFHDVEVPGRVGWWAVHGSADPQRVRYELRDWFLIMKKLHGKERLLTPLSTINSLRFVLPNLLAYMSRGKSKKLLLKSLLIGYIEGIRISGLTC